jgi:hypothetical protein
VRAIGLRSLVLLFVCAAGFSHAQGAAGPDAAALIGNWHVFGSTDPKSSGASVSIYADGDRIYGSGTYNILCRNGGNVGGGFVVEGAISSGGTFILDSPKYIEDESRSGEETKITIGGEIPGAGESTWAGTYSIARIGPDGPDEHCPALSGDFVAARYAPPSGTYSGTIVGPGFGSGTPVTLDLRPSGAHCYPNMNTDTGSQKVCFSSLQGSLTLNGATGISPEPITLSTAETGHFDQIGDGFSLGLVLDDGSGLEILCTFQDVSSGVLRAAIVFKSSNGEFDNSIRGQAKLTRR